MRSEFSITLDHVRCHIQNHTESVVRLEQVDQRPHYHYSMEFHCVFSGEETILLPTQNKELTIAPGQILLLPPHTYHGGVTRKKRGGTAMLQLRY